MLLILFLIFASLLFAGLRGSFLKTWVILIFFETCQALILAIADSFGESALIATHVSAIAALGAYFIYKKKNPLRGFSFPTLNEKNQKILSGCALIFLIGGFQLWKVHYHYTGFITNDRRVHQEVEGLSYPYPVVSDEWYAIGLMKQSFATGSVPNRIYTLKTEDPFFNVQMPFHLLNASIFKIFHLDFFKAYVPFGIFFNLMIFVSFFVTVYLLTSAWIPSLLGTLFLSQITHSAVAAGFWAFIPVHMGVLHLLLTLYFVLKKEWKTASASWILSALFYPPLALIGMPFLLGAVPFKMDFKKQVLAWVGALLGVLLCVYLLLFFSAPNAFSSVASIFNYLFKRVVYLSDTGDFRVTLYPFYVLPGVAVLFAFFGVQKAWRNFSSLLLVTGVVLGYWIFCLFFPYRVLLSLERTAFMGSILLAILAVFGIQEIHSRFPKRTKKSPRYAATVFLFFVAAWGLARTVYYTEWNPWEKIYAYNPNNPKVTVTAEAPMNNYFNAEDIEAFSGVTGKQVISTPWKSLFLSTLTGNYVINPKAGTIAARQSDWSNQRFIASDCTQRQELLKNVDYLFVPAEFNCPFLKVLRKTSEKYVLYQVEH